LFHWIRDTVIKDIDSNDHGTCTSCFGVSVQTPLHWKTFDVFQEWLMDVPLAVQIVREKFITVTTLKRSDNIHRTLEHKLRRLYLILDSLLNIANRTYIGGLQEKNTQELVLKYRCIKTVFSVTANSGITMSLQASEDQIKEKALPDKCYYNTYLRKFKVTYPSSDGEKEEFLSLRDCLNKTFSIDNLCD
jgi:hypothetical protein